MVFQTESILEVKKLNVNFSTHYGTIRAVDEVSFSLKKGEVLGIVGESGSGKSVSCLSIMRLNPETKCQVQGEILFNNQNLLKIPEKEMQKIRGRSISMIFQEPMSSLNPVYTVGRQIMESVLIHQNISKKNAYDLSLELLNKVGVYPPKQRMKNYPYQLSGGICQRVMIAMALSCNPQILIADEPTTALDVTIQAQILDLIKNLIEEFKMSIILVTHDFGVVRELTEKVIVMYGGCIVEEGNINSVFKLPKHPYTKGLIDSIPRISERQNRLPVIPGHVLSGRQLIEGCPFYSRCSKRIDICKDKKPVLSKLTNGNRVACFNPLHY
jgi:oligopeptide/dipeptide ABC transporter ATP-binding protein